MEVIIISDSRIHIPNSHEIASKVLKPFVPLSQLTTGNCTCRSPTCQLPQACPGFLTNHILLISETSSSLLFFFSFFFLPFIFILQRQTIDSLGASKGYCSFRHLPLLFFISPPFPSLFFNLTPLTTYTFPHLLSSSKTNTKHQKQQQSDSHRQHDEGVLVRPIQSPDPALPLGMG
jgi:hypothetical protein